MGIVRQELRAVSEYAYSDSGFGILIWLGEL
jgi:hypothetical protein